jgi:N-methylhydantoinase A
MTASSCNKVPSTPANPAQAVIARLARTRRDHDIDLARDHAALATARRFATNALIQRRGGKVALVVTEGFRDLIEIGRQIRRMSSACRTTIRRRWCRANSASSGRAHHGGQQHRQGAHGERALQHWSSRSATPGPTPARCACCSSFLNPAHETMIRNALSATYPDMYLSISSEVQPEFREYERLSTTVLNAYLQPVIDGYLGDFAAGVAEGRARGGARINQSPAG